LSKVLDSSLIAKFFSTVFSSENLLRVRNTEKIVVALVGNKSDLENDRQVKREEANDLANSFGIPYYETSALTRDNVDKVCILEFFICFECEEKTSY
jgi:GTPase SAR1 family protein